MTSSSSEIKLDWDRTDRIGLAEAIFCLQKSVEQIQSILEEARKKMKPIMRRYKFSKNIYKKAAEKMVKTGGGVLSHPVGLAVHDDGPYRKGPLKVGHVFSVDPQMWVPEENLYLRYEDTVVVTESGNENFTDFLPSELDDLETLVRAKGMLQSFPEDLMKWNY